jgi:hypothetical protein
MEKAAPDQYAAYLNAQKAALTPGDLASRGEDSAAAKKYWDAGSSEFS